MFLHNGKMKSMKDLVTESGINYLILYNRIVRDNWDVETAVSTPPLSKKPIRHFVIHKGIKKALSDLATETGISYGCLFHRMKSGLSVEAAISLKFVPRRKPKDLAKGIKRYHTVMRRFFTKAIRLASYDRLKDDYEYFKSLDRAEAA